MQRARRLRVARRLGRGRTRQGRTDCAWRCAPRRAAAPAPSAAAAPPRGRARASPTRSASAHRSGRIAGCAVHRPGAPGVRADVAHPRRPATAESSRSVPTAWPGTRHDDEMREIEDARIVAPRGNFCKRIRAGDEEKLRCLSILARAAAPACDAVYDGPSAASSMSSTTSPALIRRSPSRPSRTDAPATSAAAAVRCGGMLAGTIRT